MVESGLSCIDLINGNAIPLVLPPTISTIFPLFVCPIVPFHQLCRCRFPATRPTFRPVTLCSIIFSGESLDGVQNCRYCLSHADRQQRRLFVAIAVGGEKKNRMKGDGAIEISMNFDLEIEQIVDKSFSSI